MRVELTDFELEEEPELIFDVLSGLAGLADFEAEEEADSIFAAAPDASAGATAATAESLVCFFFFATSSLLVFAICSFIIASTLSLTPYSLNERLNWVTCGLDCRRYRTDKLESTDNDNR